MLPLGLIFTGFQPARGKAIATILVPGFRSEMNFDFNFSWVSGKR